MKEEGLGEEEVEGSAAESGEDGGFLHGQQHAARFADMGLREGAEAETDAAALAALHGLRSRHWSEFTERAAMEEGAEQMAEAHAQEQAAAQQEALSRQQAMAFAFAQQQATMQQQREAALAAQSAYSPAQRAHRLREMQAELKKKVALLRERLAEKKRKQEQEQESQGQEAAEERSEESNAEGSSSTARQELEKLVSDSQTEEGGESGEQEGEGEVEEKAFRRPIMVDSLESSEEGEKQD
jgi:hypothetical protein